MKTMTTREAEITTTVTVLQSIVVKLSKLGLDNACEALNDGIDYLIAEVSDDDEDL